MAKDLDGYKDADDFYSEIDAETVEHVRQTVYRSVSTPRGYDREDDESPGWWVDLVDFAQALAPRAVGAVQGAANSAANTLSDIDERIVRANVTAELVGTVVRWTANVLTRFGEVLIDEELAPLPGPEDPAPPAPEPVDQRPMLADLATDPSFTPAWLIQKNNGKILWTVGILGDVSIQWLVDGMQQRLPLYAEEAALPFLSRDRGIRRGAAEDVGGLRQRLVRWLPSHRRKGNPFAILEQVQAYFSPGAPLVRIVEHAPARAGRPSRATWSSTFPDGAEVVQVQSPSNFDWDSADPLADETRDHVRFFLLVYQPPAAGALFVEDQITDDLPGATWSTIGPTNSYGNAQDLLQMANDWKSSGSWVAGAIVVFDQASFLPLGTGPGYPDGTWHLYADPETGQPKRNPGAAYFGIRRRPETVG